MAVQETPARSVEAQHREENTSLNKSQAGLCLYEPEDYCQFKSLQTLKKLQRIMVEALGLKITGITWSL